MGGLSRWSVPGGRVFGIPIRLHIFLLVFLVGELWHAIHLFQGDGLWIGLIQWVLIYVFILQHELGHCFAGRHHRGEVDQILLWPLGGLAMISGLPNRARPQIWTAVSGPLVNAAWCIVIGIALVVGGLGREVMAAMPLFGAGYPWPDTHGYGWFFVCYAFHVNLLNMCFNLLPAWPLDGGRIFVWSLAPRLGFPRAAHVGTTVGFGAAIALGLAAVLSSSVLLALIAVFIALQCHQERQLLREGLYHVEDGAFGYDFSQGYTSLEGRAGSVERPPRPRRPWFWQRWRREREVRSLEESMSQELAMRSRVEALLEKISTQGIEALTAEERAFLQTASKKFG